MDIRKYLDGLHLDYDLLNDTKENLAEAKAFLSDPIGAIEEEKQGLDKMLKEDWLTDECRKVLAASRAKYDNKEYYQKVLEMEINMKKFIVKHKGNLEKAAEDWANSL